MAESYFETDTITKEYDSRLVRRILSYLKPYKHLVFLTLGALVISTLGELLIPILLRRIIDEGIMDKNTSFLIHGCILYFIILIFVFGFSFLQTLTANLMTQRVMKDMRLSLFQKTLSQSTGYLSRHPVGRIVTRLTSDVQTMDEFFTTVLVAFIKDIAIMTGTLVTMFILSPQMAIMV
ncbi:MAG: hypothetical protein LBC80_05510, partial [Treponema sp.]|nr:hypothetical protein [Treponema sp.]